MAKEKNISQTPLMRQYQQIKAKYPDTLLLYRMGDFFETFEEDARITSSVLGITLTKRANGAASDVPLAGFPHHALDNYLPKLVKAGYRVAVCEQMEDPKFARGIVKRDVIEVVTPGVTLNDKLLENKKNNYLASVFFNKESVGFAFADISTGEFFASELSRHDFKEQIENIAPTEVLFPKSEKNFITEFFEHSGMSKPVLTKIDDWVFSYDFGYEILIKHFNTNTLKGFGIENLRNAIIAAGAILNYFQETQKVNLTHLKRISKFDPGDFIILDPATKRNLEITTSISEGEKEGTLIAVLDRTNTPMGGRLFKRWLSRPLKNIEKIQSRLDSVKELVQTPEIRKNLSSELSEIGDVERLISKICTGRAVPRDVLALKQFLVKIPGLKELLSGFKSTALNNIYKSLDSIPVIIEKISKALDENALLGGSGASIIKKGYSEELDEIKDILINGKNWITNFQKTEREKSGINSLKVEFNSVFGYYIEISKANLNKVPSDYVRKQTLVNAERYITPELKNYEDKILNAEEKVNTLEKELFNQLKSMISDEAEAVQRNAQIVALLDCFCGLAEVAQDYKYVYPEVNEGSKIEIKDGRHPVIERTLPIGVPFIPNDVILDNEDNQILIITGPNMAGKSVFLRQTGLIVLLAQIGSFVPAKKAVIGIVDKIFTRVGASDNIASGESTFLVEMHETANILNNATPKSLVLLDEVGRGTSTFDGISIAWALTEYLHENPAIAAKTLFATHYHELNELAIIFPRIKNYKVEVREIGDKVIFLRKVVEGSADHSYGIQVAKMAGLPDEVTERAKEILKNLEDSELNIHENLEEEKNEGIKDKKNILKNIKLRKFEPNLFQVNLFEMKDSKIHKEIDSMDIENMTPLQALQKLNELKKVIKE